MKVGPHSGMTLADIVESKKNEEIFHHCHYWGYSGVFCRPSATQQFCERAKEAYGEEPQLILIKTKSAYNSEIGFITRYSLDGLKYNYFDNPVQLQGAQYAFVARGLHELEGFRLSDYKVYGGKNNGISLQDHLRFRVNKSFATLCDEWKSQINYSDELIVLSATLVPPYAVWLKE